MINDFSKLKEIRKEKGFTIARISKQLGVPIRTYENWENGYRYPPNMVTIVDIRKNKGLIKSLILFSIELQYRSIKYSISRLSRQPLAFRK